MKKIIAMALALLMLLSVLPMSVLAAENDLNLGSGSCDYYNLIEKSDYNLAPGAVESEIIINDDSGNRRQVVHVIEVDPNSESISVMPSFKNISKDVDYADQSNCGIMEMSKQAAYVEETLGKNVVGAMNVCLSWDFTHPYGLLVYEGEILSDNRASCETCGKGHPGGGYLVIYKDGKAELRDAMEPLTGEEWMAQTVCFSFLVRDGVNKHTSEDHSDANGAPRSVIGVKEDGTLVIMMVDGRMSPYSAGFTNHEMAQMMIDLGCVDAINCDGGGSSTFITEREGTGELTVKSRFSDGAERATLTGILIVSNAVADGRFDHVAIEADNKLVTPGSVVNFSATGADSAGGPAEIPENVSWQLKDSSFGTIADGVFESNGKTGFVTAQMVYEGEVVGEATIEVVIPNSITFVMANITAPYTKTVSLDVIAKYGHTEVALKEGDIEYALSDATMGTISGIKFTATSNESVKGGTVTATLVHNRNLVAVANITLGKGSDIVYDFESGDESIADWKLAYKGVYTPDKYYFNDEISVVSVEDGAKVRNGNYALKVTVDGDSITCMNWCQTKIQGMNIDLTDAVSLSFWIYIPEGSHGLEWDFGNAIPVVLGHEFQYGTGWQYLTVNVKDIGSNVTNLNEIRLYHSDTNNSGNGYNHYEHPNYYADVVYYIDDITVNYSSAVEDNDAPVISDASVSHANIDTPVAMKGQDVDASVVSFTAKANDNVGLTNYTGLDADSLIVLVDGKQVNATCSDNGFITTNDMELANGVHTVVFMIADNNGNYNMYKEYSINIVGNNDKNTIKYVPANPELKDVPQGSLVWMNLVATEIEKVSKVTVTLDLDQNSKWELDHMILADGFSAEYTIDAETNDATITITATGDVTLSGEAVLATLPIRVWVPAFLSGGNEDAKSYRLVSVMSYVQMGELVETDATVAVFASAMQTISTEWNSTRLTSIVDKESWHIHSAEAMEDVAATCTLDGYIGRTFCAGCNSVVEWGTTLLATGHSYDHNEGVLSCDCGDRFTGLYSDGKEYVDGVVVSDGWVGDSYYVNGELLTGVHKVPSPDDEAEYYYNFGNDGICKNRVKYTGIFFDASVDANRYAYLGALAASWQMIGEDWYYFRHDTYTAATGVYDYYGIPYTFDDQGKLIKGAWVETDGGVKYFCYSNNFYHFCWQEIDGEMYYFDRSGYRVSGFTQVRETFTEDYRWYEFTDEGVLVGIVDGIENVDGQNRYYVNGVQTAAGLIEIDGSYYYARTNGLIATGTYYVSKHSTTELAEKFPVGNYTFDSNGKMIIEEEEEPVVLNGIHADSEGKLRYYVNGVKTAAGLIEIDGSYYYARTNGLIATGTYYVSKHSTTELAEKFPVGNYTFDSNGKMIIEEEEEPVVLNGIHADSEGKLRYYVNGVKTAAGLIEIDGSYYYARTNGLIATGTYYVSKHSTTELAEKFPVGNYTFDSDGKMIVE